MTHWFFESLVHWLTRSTVIHDFTGSLRYWLIESLNRWFIVICFFIVSLSRWIQTLIHWSLGSLLHCLFHSVVQWFFHVISLASEQPSAHCLFHSFHLFFHSYPFILSSLRYCALSCFMRFVHFIPCDFTSLDFIFMSFHSIIHWFTLWITESLNHWFVDPLTHCFTVMIRVNDSLIRWCTDSLNDWKSLMIHWFFLIFPIVGSLTHWFPDSMTHWFFESLVHRLTRSTVIHDFTGSLRYWLIESLNRWFIDLFLYIVSLSRWIQTLIHWSLGSLLHCLFHSVVQWCFHVISLASEQPSAHCLFHSCHSFFRSFILSFFHPCAIALFHVSCASFISFKVISLHLISFHVMSFNHSLVCSWNHWIVEPMIRWFTDSLLHCDDPGEWFVDSLMHWFAEWLNHRWFIDLYDFSTRWLIDSLVPWFNDSLILWIVGSLTHSVDCDSWFHWLVALLTHWVVEPLVHCDLFLYCFIESLNSDTDSLIPWFIASLPSFIQLCSDAFTSFHWHLSNHLLIACFIHFIYSFIRSSFHSFILALLRSFMFSCASFISFLHVISLHLISCHVMSFNHSLVLLFESLNRWTNDSLIHWLIASLWWPAQWFVDSLMHWFAEWLNHRWFIDLFDFSTRWLINSLVPWFNDSLILWIVGSLTHSVDCDSWFHWLVALLTHWVVEPLIHWFVSLYCFIESLNSDPDSLIPWFIASLPLSFSCAVILSRNFIGIWATICSLLVSFISFILSFFHPFILSSLRYCSLSCFHALLSFHSMWFHFTWFHFMSFHSIIHWFTLWITESLNQCFVDPLTHCFTVMIRFNDSLIRWCTDSLNDWKSPMIHWFIWFFHSLVHWLTGSLIQWLTDSLNRWFVDSLGRLWFMISLARGATDSIESLNRWFIVICFFIVSLSRWIQTLIHWSLGSLLHCLFHSVVQWCFHVISLASEQPSAHCLFHSFHLFFRSFILSFFHPCAIALFHVSCASFISFKVISLHLISFHVMSFNHSLVCSWNHWIVEPMIRWFTDSLLHCDDPGEWFVDSLMHWFAEWLNHRWSIDLFDFSTRWLIDSLVPWFNDSLILWIVGSLTHSVDCDSWFHWLVALLTHWVVEPLIHWFVSIYCFIESLNSDTDSLIPWFIASLPLSFSCAVILSRHFIGHLSNHLLIRWSISQLQRFMASAS